MVTPSRFGKGIAYDTPVLTTEGWKNHGDLHMGDYVFHPSGKAIPVLAETPDTPTEYRVHFQNGQTIDCHDVHEWRVFDRTMRKTHRENGKKIVDEYGGYRILETKELAEKNLTQFCNGRERSVFFVDSPNLCQFQEKVQSLYPHLVGCWLGDGTKNTTSLTTHNNNVDRIVPHRRIGITKVEKISNGKQGKCIEVGSEDGLYLVGKSLITTHNSFLNAILVIIKAAGEGKEVRVGGATKEKAGIIQEKVVGLLPYTAKAVQDGLIVTEEDGDINKKVARMSTQVSKEALAWRNGGSIRLFSTNENRKNTEVAAAGAVGIGGDFVTLDEVQLMTPAGFNTASRFMMENPDTKRFCVGNPSISGHFKDLYDNPSTFVVHLNDIGAIVEGRMSRRGMELTGMPSYSAEYRSYIQVEFPDENSGTRFFPTLPLPLTSQKFPKPTSQHWFMGIDSAYKGGDALMVTLLTYNEAEDMKWIVVESQIDLKQKYPEWNDETTTNISLDILKLIQDFNIEQACLDIGLGIHIYEALTRLDPDVPLEPVNFAQKPTEWRAESDYNAKVAMNARAEMHLDLRDLCENKLVYINGDNYDDVIRQMREIGAKTDVVGSKIRVEPKQDIKKRLGRSPDNLDSLCLAVRAMVISGLIGANNGDDGDLDYAEFI